MGLFKEYRKKPVVIEAFQLQPEHFTGAELVETDFDATIVIDAEERCIHIHTLEGTMKAELGDWLIRGIKGGLYPCKPDIFEETYEPVEDSAWHRLPDHL